MPIAALNIAATGMSVAVDQINTTANNLSNFGSTGFKHLLLTSTELKVQTRMPAGIRLSEGGEPSPVGVQFGSGAKTAAIFRVMQQGELKPSGNALHLAINGSGYFKVDAGNGRVFYTRNGAFSKNKDGLIETAEGYIVMPGIPIQSDLPLDDPARFKITDEGRVFVKPNPGGPFEEVGRLAMARFPNDAGLEAVEGGYFMENLDASGPEIPGFPRSESFGAVSQGHLEQSTVDAVKELTDAIAAQRQYELTSKMITAADNMYNTLNQMK